MLAPTLVDIGTAGRFTNCVEIELFDQVSDLVIPLGSLEPDPQPVGPSPGARGLVIATVAGTGVRPTNLDKTLTHDSRVYRMTHCLGAE